MNFSVFSSHAKTKKCIFLGQTPRIIEKSDPIVAAAIGRERKTRKKRVERDKN
jgi:hypothetical protein